MLMLLFWILLAYYLYIRFLSKAKDKFFEYIPKTTKDIPAGILQRIAYTFFQYVRSSRPKRVFPYLPDPSSPENNGYLPCESEVVLENVNKELTSYDSVDGMTFTGTDSKGTSYFMRINRRQNRVAEVWLYLRLPDGRQYCLPQHPDTIFYSTDSESFTGAGLMLECIEPMRRWKVAFNGLLRRYADSGLCADKMDTVHAFISFRWSPFTYVVDHSHDMPASIMTKMVLEEGFDKLSMVDSMLRYSQMDRYDQWGMLQGDIKFEEEEIFVQLKGLRARHLGALNWSHTTAFIEILAHHENGNDVLLGCSSHLYGFSNFQYGYTYRPEGKFYMIQESSLTLDMFDDLMNRNSCTISFTGRDKTYTIGVSVSSEGFLVNAGDKWDCQVQIYNATFMSCGKAGRGFVMLGKRIDLLPPERSVLSKLLPDPKPLTSPAPFVLDFSDERCRLSSEVGGKGGSLASLTAMEQDKFLVPPGFCVSAEAYWKQLKERPHLQSCILNLDAVVCQRQRGDMNAECKRVMDEFTQTAIIPEINNSVKNQLWKMYGPAQTKVLLAVRSSAIGEDSADLSAAGQNETFLGVKGVSELEEAIRKCWASQFAFQAVQYRRQHGQLINCGMSVVVQEMIPSEVAGVMFTRDPLTGNPETIMITANYGLGESVVSASADPDTIRIKRTWDNRLSIESKIIGLKAAKIEVRATGGTETINLTSAQAGQCCLPDELSLKLAEIGVMVEHAFGDPRDIEFGVTRGQVYMLQARPITSLYPESEEELLREHNTALRTDREFATNANIGEVFRGATSPLSVSTVMFALDFCFQFFGYLGLPEEKFTYVPYYFGTHVGCGRQMFFNLGDLLGALNPAGDKFSNQAWEVSFFGRIVNLDEIYNTLKEKYGPTTTFKKFKAFVDACIGVATHPKSLEAQVNYFKQWKVPLDNVTSAQACYDTICENAVPFFTAWIDHIAATAYSNFLNSNMMAQLFSGSSNQEFTLNTYTDFATLLSCSSSWIESADVPKSLGELASTIVADPECKVFMEMDRDSALVWLQDHPGAVGEKYNEFITTHGHRCLKEYDLYSITWGTNPLPVVDNLQEMVKHPAALENKRKELTVDDAIDSLNSPITWTARKILRYLVPLSQRGVAQREKSKSLYVRVNNHFRVAFRKLAAMMVSEGRLPEEDLLFFITNWEIKELLRTRNPKIVSRSIRRKRIHDYLDGLIYPELSVGWPIPARNARANGIIIDTQHGSNSVRVTGTPVSQGIVQGPARVVVELKDAHQIQAGDILITYATDIAWSPYFPMLAGVVTELGGLISHGAVVAREYGLPCIVGAKTATEVFRSGDTVLLNGTKGFLEKVG